MNRSILVVDDEVHIRMLLEQTLEELEDDYAVEVISVGDGERGLALIREIKPDLVFLDIMMPGKNGYAVCSEVRSDPGLDCVKIVLLTAKGQELDRKAGLESGAQLYMTKPFDPDEIVGVSKKLLGLSI